MLDRIVKRDGREVMFDAEKIASAILKALVATGSAKGEGDARELAQQVVEDLQRNEAIGVPTVEQVQDAVEQVLIKNGFVAPPRVTSVSRRAQPRPGDEYPPDANL